MGLTNDYRAEIETTLAQLSETINTLRQKAELHPGMAKGAGNKELDELERQMQDLRDVLDKLEKEPQEKHAALKEQIDAYTGDLNQTIRKAWAYYK